MLLLAWCAKTNEENKPQESTIVAKIPNTEDTIQQTPTENPQITVDTIQKLLLADPKVRASLADLCKEENPSCQDALNYLTKEETGTILIAFSADPTEGNPDLFTTSTEIYKITKETGTVLRRSPFSGEYDYRTTIQL